MAMSKKNHIGGKKKKGKHTTIIDAAVRPVAIAKRMPEITGVAPGFIKMGLSSTRGGIAIKIKSERSCILLCIRGNTSAQEIRLYAPNISDAVRHIADEFQKDGIQIYVQ